MGNEEPYKFHSIENFRDLAGPLGKYGISRNLIFRSAALDTTSRQDIDTLVSKCNIRTILDLRARDDAKTKQGPFKLFPRAREVRLAARINTAATKAKLHKRRVINRGLASKTIMINFTGKKYIKYIWDQLDNSSRRKLLIYRLFQKEKASKLVGREVLDKGGLVGLYCSFIDYSGEAISMALKVLVNSINYPILIHCAQGKDRTGIVIALAFAAIGIDEETITEDYVQSKAGLERIYEKVVEEMAKKGLNPNFADAPPEAMQGMFQHIRQKYGSVERYLDSIDFTEQFRTDLKATLLHGAIEFMDRMQPKMKKVDEVIKDV